MRREVNEQLGVEEPAARRRASFRPIRQFRVAIRHVHATYPVMIASFQSTIVARSSPQGRLVSAYDRQI